MRLFIHCLNVFHEHSNAYMFFILCLICSFVCAETIYITAYDPHTKTIGQAYSSSGGNFWQHYIKNKGMVAEAASGLCSKATPRKFLQNNVTATKIAELLKEQCGSYGSYRLSIITINGDLTAMIGSRGCHEGNKICGKLNITNFNIVGGGLREGVLDAGLERWKQLDPKMDLICRLYQTLKAVYDKGGEIKPFAGASIAADNLEWDRPFYISAKGNRGNDYLIKAIYEQLPKICQVG